MTSMPDSAYRDASSYVRSLSAGQWSCPKSQACLFSDAPRENLIAVISGAHLRDPGSRGPARPMSLLSIILCAALACTLSACASTQTCYQNGTPTSELRTIYIVHRGWHTGVAIAAADWPNQRWSLLREFPSVEHLEFGWGDERFYQEEETTFWMAIRAAFWPTPSVIHVIGFATPRPSNIQADAVVTVQVSAEGLRRMAAGIERESDGAHPTASGPEVPWAPAPNRFYQATRSFYFPRMCNWWIAHRLQDAGCPILPWTVVTASRVVREARGFRGEEEESECQRGGSEVCD